LGSTPTHLRIGRPSMDLERAERFWTQGVGMSTLYRSSRADPLNLVMVGFPDEAWHIELTHDPGNAHVPETTDEDLVVLYFDGEIPSGLIDRLCEHGGTPVRHSNPYWNEWGHTFRDPDGYHLVLCRRGWTNTPLPTPEESA
jgi:catechol 2,3-dioxygenase-like lactoylglutathione lyase family enzyme